MRRTTKEFLYVAVAIAAVLLPGAVVATADEAPAEKRPAAYSVWTANCSRSLQMTATCDSLDSAFDKAHELRGEMSGDVKVHDYVLVVAGEPNWGQMLDLFRHVSAGTELKQPCQCEIYRPGCRFGWRKVDLEPDASLVTAEKTLKEGPPHRGLEIVYNLSPAPAPAPVEAQALAD